ncbi:c-type cytochrome [Castellaniella sp. WN]
MSTTPSTTSIDGRERPSRRAFGSSSAKEALFAWGRTGAVGLAAALACAAGPAALAAGPAASSLSAEQAQRVSHLLVQDCGSCHGLRMTGGLGPALTPEALRGKPRDALIATILQGRPGTPMPPWNPFLSPAEAGWIIDRLTEGHLP